MVYFRELSENSSGNMTFSCHSDQLNDCNKFICLISVSSLYWKTIFSSTFSRITWFAMSYPERDKVIFFPGWQTLQDINFSGRRVPPAPAPIPPSGICPQFLFCLGRYLYFPLYNTKLFRLLKLFSSAFENIWLWSGNFSLNMKII